MTEDAKPVDTLPKIVTSHGDLLKVPFQKYPYNCIYVKYSKTSHEEVSESGGLTSLCTQMKDYFF